MGTDEQSTTGETKQLGACKFFFERGLTFAFAGFEPVINVMRAALEKLPEGDEISISQLSRALLPTFVEHGWKPEEDEGVPPSFKSQFLVSDGKQIVEIVHGFSTRIISDEFCAIGSGWVEATSADHSMRKLRPRASARKRAWHAIEVAAALDIYCGGKPQVIRVRDRGARLVP